MSQGTRHSGQVPTEGGHGAEQRDDAVDAREARTHSREGARAVQDVLADADQRDDEADARDNSANRREPAAGIDDLLNPEEDTRVRDAQETSAEDRKNSRDDRLASKVDGATLVEDDRAYERGNRCPRSLDGDHDFLVSERADTRRVDLAQVHECRRCGFTYGDHRPADRRATSPPLVPPPLPAATDSPSSPAAVPGGKV